VATERIEIIVSSKGTVTVKKDIESVGKSARDAAGGVDLLKGALTAFLSAQTFNAFAQLTSSFTDYNSRVSQAVDSSLSADAAMGRLYDMAQRTYSTFENTAEIFLANQQALSGLGLTTLQQLDYTEALNNALVVSGTKGERAESVIRAMSDAMQLGSLRGQGLQTVLKGSSEVTALLAKELGVSADKLLKLGADGKITGDIIYNSLVRNFDMLTQKAADMPATIEDGFLRIRNALFFTIGLWDQNAQLSSTFAESLVWVSDNIELVMLGLTPLIAALTILGVQVIGGLIISAFTSFGAALTLGARGILTVATAGAQLAMIITSVLIPAVIRLTVVALTNPLLAVGTLAALGGAWVLFGDRIKQAGAAVAETAAMLADTEQLGKFLKETFNIDITGEGLAANVDEAMNKGRQLLDTGVVSGSQKGAELLKNGVAAGGASAAAAIKSAGEQAAAKYESLNGKIVKEQGKVLVDGGKYWKNEVTGEITKAGKEAGAGMNNSIKAGGESAGDAMERKISSGGQKAAAALDGPVAGLIQAAHMFSTQIDAVEKILHFQMRIMLAERDKIVAETNKLNAEANAIRNGRSADSGGGTSDHASNYSGGGSGSGNPNWFSREALYRQARENRTPQEISREVTEVDKPSQETKVEIINVLDPSLVIAANKTAEGQTTIVNTIVDYRDEIRDILGVV